MISKLYIENFRSIQKAALPLGKITVLTGANNSGKSSLLYGFLVLRDFVMNPNRSLEQLFALPFINLGGFEEVVSKQNAGGKILLGIETVDTDRNISVSYNLELSEQSTQINTASSQLFDFNAELQIGLPYSANIKRVFETFKLPEKKRFEFDWNGLAGSLKEDNHPTPSERSKFEMALNKPVEALLLSDFVPMKRGFAKPHYAPVSINGNINSEEEIATWIFNSRGKEVVNLRHYFERATGRDMFLQIQKPTSVFSIMSVQQKGTPQQQITNIVNEGTGTNQLLTILAKVFQPNKKFICIDEPEIHLHPSMVRTLAASLLEIAVQHDKQFLISTHSEHFVQALMSQVAEGKASPEDIKVYFLERNGPETTIEAQPINEKGQIAGGLSHFYESELADLQSFFKLVD
ncbi:MAG: AAA family ATPase [Saprospiraceae bacterium]